MKWLSSTFIIFISFFLLGQPVRAMEFKSGEMITVGAGEVINGSLFVAGNSVTVDGIVEGDVFCAGQNILISGRVDGDVICGGQNVRVTGPVGGNVRIAGQTLELSSIVARNTMMAGQTLTVSNDASVAGELLFGGQLFTLSGFVGKGVTGAGEKVLIDGTVGGDVLVQAESLDLMNEAEVRGSLKYGSDKDAVIDADASVSGTIARTKMHKGKDTVQNSRVDKPSRPWPANTFPGVVFHLLAGLIVVGLFPKFTIRVLKHLSDTPVLTGLKGAAVIFFAPVVILSLFLTIIGIPAGILGVAVYMCVIVLSRLFVGVAVGRALLDNFSKNSSENVYVYALIGIPVLWFLLKAPLIGGLFSFLAIIWGTGALFMAFKKVKK